MRDSQIWIVSSALLGGLACGGSSDDADTTEAATSNADAGSSESGGEASGDSSPTTDGGDTTTSPDPPNDTTTAGDDTTGGVVDPGYTPFFAMDCNDGALGTEAVGADAMADATRMEYSDDEAVDGRGGSCRTWIDAGSNFFGGRYVTPQISIGDGDDIWMRQALLFPEGFCFGYGDTPGDGWGAIKWMRMEFDNGGDGGGPGDRLTLQLGDIGAQACNPDTEIYGATREYAGNANLRPRSSPPLQTGQWHMIQWHVHLAADETAFIRFWLDDTFLGQVDDVTLGAPERQLAFINYGDYWNGSPFQDASWYTDEVIMTVETPDTTDAEGHPYIAPSARADDWD
jgi:hypothetical protein